MPAKEPQPAKEPRARDAQPRATAADKEHDNINAEHKAAMEKCKDLKGNAKDVCKAEADAKRKVARAETKLKENNTPENQRDLDKAKAEAEYDVAKEKCEDQKGDQQKACKKEAKAKKDMALASAKKK